MQVRDAFSAVQAASYGTGLALLEAMKPRVWVDMIVGPHIDALYAKIYSRCIIEYANAFKSLSLVSMAEKFNLKSRYVSQSAVHVSEMMNLAQFTC